MAAPTPYDRLVQAGLALTYTELFERDLEPSNEEAADYLRSNEQSLAAARRALQERCAVAVRYEPEFFTEHASSYQPLRNLCRSFALEVEHAARRGEWARAVHSGLEILKLAAAMRRGGLLVDLLVGIAMEGVAIERLRRIRHQLGPDEAKGLAGALLQAEADREPFEVVLLRDERWEQATSDEKPAPLPALPDEALMQLEEKCGPEAAEIIVAEMYRFCQLSPAELHQIERQQDARSVTLLRLLAVELAVYAYRADRGHYPGALSDLATEYLERVECDPFTGGPLIYRTTGHGFVLYSTGPSGHDAGGTFADWLGVTNNGADLCLDMFDH